MNTYNFTEQQVRTLTEAAFDAGVNSISCQLGTCDVSYIDDAAVAFDRESAVLVALAAIIAEPKVPCSSRINPEAREFQALIPAADAPKHSDFDLAVQMNADFHRIENQRGTIEQFQRDGAPQDTGLKGAGRIHVANWIGGPSRTLVQFANMDEEATIAKLCAESGDDQDDYTVTALYAEVYSDPNADKGTKPWQPKK